MSTTRNTVQVTMHMNENELDALVKALAELPEGNAARSLLPYLKSQLDGLARKNRAQEWQAQLKADGRCTGCEQPEDRCCCDLY